MLKAGSRFSVFTGSQGADYLTIWDLPSFAEGWKSYILNTEFVYSPDIHFLPAFWSPPRKLNVPQLEAGLPFEAGSAQSVYRLLFSVF